MAGNGRVLALTTPDGRRPRVALIGGSPVNAMVASVLIEQFGGRAINAPTGSAVLALLQIDDPIDLVLIDVSRPELDAVAATQLMQVLGPRELPPVIALTDKDSGASLAAVHAAGFAGALAKPYSPRELYGAMQLALACPATVVAGHA